MKILITGVAGFIGFHAAKKFAQNGYEVYGIDNINDYYDPNLKIARLKELGISNFGATNFDGDGEIKFARCDLADLTGLKSIWLDFDVVVNLAAQAGVRYSMENPQAYTDSNLVGFMNILELCRHNKVKHLVYASSSSVYGLNSKMPFEETDPVDHPASLYAASKRANELLAHSYSNLYGLPTTGLRFFTVYGPWGRPDMFAYKLAESIAKQKEITIYTRDGQSLWRDYTFVDDIVEGVFRISQKIPTSKSADQPDQSAAPFEIFNIGNSSPVENSAFISSIEEAMGQKAVLRYEEAPKTEVFKTYASTQKLEREIGYVPQVDYKEGTKQFVEWYLKYSKGV